MSKERIEELEAQIQYHSDLYYNGQGEITDAEFDELVDELTAHAPNSEVLQAVGAPTSGSGAKLTHKTQMGSLAKVTYDEEGEISQLLKWAAKDTTVQGVRELSMTPKIDGLAVRLNYYNGKLIQAATRGDGAVGQDVTENVLAIAEIPNQTDSGFSGEIRGEIYMKKSVFEAHRAKGMTLANPRNAASGSLMQKDPKKTASRNLSFFAYDIIFDDDCPTKVTFTAEREKYWALNRLSDIEAVPQVRVKVSDLENFLYDWEHNKRAKLDYEIDGLVGGYTSLEAQEDAGWNGKRPRGKVAWKFAPEQKVTTLEGINWQVGRTGRITPVGRITATQLSGSCIRNVTLHNVGNINEKKLSIGDKVLLEKAGEIIPHIVEVHEHVVPFVKGANIPTECPACGGTVSEDEKNLWCMNLNCHSKLESRIEHFLKRLGVLGIGSSTIKGLVACGALKDLADLYYMNSDDLVAVTGSDLVARNMLEDIFAKSEIPLSVFLSALGIHTLGRTSSKDVAKELRTLEAVRNVSHPRLRGIAGIGDKTASSIIAGMDDMKETIDRLLEVIDVIDVEDVSGPLTGMSFCLTGSMSRQRTVIAVDIEAAGGEVKSSVGKGLTYLVQADPTSESSKTKKAAKNGTQVISEEHLMGLIG